MFNWFNKREKKVNQVNEPQSRSIYQPLPKYYMFNETGNIMLCTSERNIGGFDEDIKNSFIDVTVFFAAMSKAIHTTKNPKTDAYYSIYNYQAVKNVLLSSGMFIEVNVEENAFESEGVGESLGKAFLQHALNRNFGDVNLPFTRAMFNGMKYQHSLNKATSHQDIASDARYFRGGSIFFICEILMGIPQTTAVLLNIEPESEEDTDAEQKHLGKSANMFDLGCKYENEHQPQHQNRRWKFKKRSYLFVPPKFIANNSASLSNGDNAQVSALVEKLQEGLKNKSLSQR